MRLRPRGFRHPRPRTVPSSSHIRGWILAGGMSAPAAACPEKPLLSPPPSAPGFPRAGPPPERTGSLSDEPVLMLRERQKSIVTSGLPVPTRPRSRLLGQLSSRQSPLWREAKDTRANEISCSFDLPVCAPACVRVHVLSGCLCSLFLHLCVSPLIQEQTDGCVPRCIYVSIS